jgi:hypothetical protein
VWKRKIPDEKLIKDSLFFGLPYGDYPFNFGNSIGETGAFVNYILPLDATYVDLAKRFSGDAIQNIRRSEGYGFYYEKGEIDEAFHYFLKLYGALAGVTREQFTRFRKLCNFHWEKWRDHSEKSDRTRWIFTGDSITAKV